MIAEFLFAAILPFGFGRRILIFLFPDVGDSPMALLRDTDGKVTKEEEEEVEEEAEGEGEERAGSGQAGVAMGASTAGGDAFLSPLSLAAVSPHTRLLLSIPSSSSDLLGPEEADLLEIGHIRNVCL